MSMHAPMYDVRTPDTFQPLDAPPPDTGLEATPPAEAPARRRFYVPVRVKYILILLASPILIGISVLD